MSIWDEETAEHAQITLVDRGVPPRWPTLQMIVDEEDPEVLHLGMSGGNPFVIRPVLFTFRGGRLDAIDRHRGADYTMRLERALLHSYPGGDIDTILAAVEREMGWEQDDPCAVEGGTNADD